MFCLSEHFEFDRMFFQQDDTGTQLGEDFLICRDQTLFLFSFSYFFKQEIDISNTVKKTVDVVLGYSSKGRFVMIPLSNSKKFEFLKF